MAHPLQPSCYRTAPTKPATLLALKAASAVIQKQKDGYVLAELTLSFNLTSYRCPTAN